MSSKFSNLTGGTLTPRGVPSQTTNDFDSNDLALETFVNSLQLHTFFDATEEEQNERLAKIDVLELFRAVQNINHELGMAQLENYCLIDFLQKNDPKLLIGLEKCRATKISSARGSRSTKSIGASIMTGTSLLGYRSKSLLSRSFKDSLSMASQKRNIQEYKLNFRAKSEIAEKLANDVEKRVREMERTASQEIKVLRGHMEEMRILQVETQETAKNFELHFLRDEDDIAFLNEASEKQLDRKFRKFVNNWVKNARALLATMRLKITALQEHCQHLRNDLLTKADLSGILTAVDFEKLMIRRSELLRDLEDKNAHMVGLKGVTGKAALSLAEERQTLMDIDEESKQINNKTLEVAKGITKLEKEANTVEKENEKDILILENLRSQLERFEAPSINQYIEKKDEVLALEKEEKMLRRKISILKMKLDNTQKKCKRKIDASMVINVIE